MSALPVTGNVLGGIVETPIPPAPVGIPIARTVVHVTADMNQLTVDSTSPPAFHATAPEILPSAGTYGDFVRYLEDYPGVAGNGDWSNDLIVRGGNPMENLFLVDGIEVPNISQIAVEGSTGGLSTMIDTAAIRGVDLYTGGYDATYDERLSSIVAIETRSESDGEQHGEGDVGYIGAGGLTLIPLGRNGSMAMSAHRSFLNLISSNIGLGGTPVYSNMLLDARIHPTDADELNFLNLSGWDQLDTAPGGPEHDPYGSNEINMQFSGWRTTNGFRWRHMASRRLLGTLTASDSEGQENIEEQDQFPDVLSITPQQGQQLQPVPVYSQISHDGRANLKYDVLYDGGAKWLLMAGTGAYLNRINYRVAQPAGEQSPYSADPTATDADSFAPNFMSGETASYAELTWHPATRWSVSGGGRVQTFAEDGRWTATPRLNSAFQISRHTGIHAAFGEYAQLPPMMDMISWTQNRSLLPIRARHFVAGADLYRGMHGRIGIEAYQKNYRDYPVSTQYPSLSLANMVDDLGTQISWLPLTSEGAGRARGVELSAAAHVGEHLSGQLSLARSHVDYAGTDHVLRPGNFDYPIAGTTSGTWRSGNRYEASWKYEYSSGRPYTPFLLQQSMEQNRTIYDTSRLNALRGPVYSRLDVEADRNFTIGLRHLVVYAGVDNLWNRKNFLEYLWMPRADAYWGCHGNAKNCVTEIDSFSRYPDGGIRYRF